MAINTGFQQQQPFARSAAVRSVPSPRSGARLDLRDDAGRAEGKPPIAPEENSVPPRVGR